MFNRQVVINNDTYSRLDSDKLPPSVSWSDLPEELYVAKRYANVYKNGKLTNTHEYKIFYKTELIGTFLKTINRHTQVYFGKRKFSPEGEKSCNMFAYREEAVAFVYYGYLRSQQ